MVDYTGPRDFVSGRFGSSPNRSPRVRPPRPGIFGRTEFRTRGWAPRRNSRLDRHPDPLDRSSLSISQLASCPRANPLLGGSGQRNRRTSSSPPRLQRGGIKRKRLVSRRQSIWQSGGAYFPLEPAGKRELDAISAHSAAGTFFLRKPDHDSFTLTVMVFANSFPYDS